jgi:pimeloyl-ACP methyl ester carboxylesterase
MLEARVPMWIDRRKGDGSVAVIVHDVGDAPMELDDAMGAVLLPHLRGHGRSGHVRGGSFPTADFAADIVRLLRAVEGPVVLAGLGQSALIAALAAAAEPGAVRGLVLAPGSAVVPCDTQPTPLRHRWIAQVLAAGGVEPTAQQAVPEPLTARHRDLIWSKAPRPIGWVGDPRGEWTLGAPADLVEAETTDRVADVLRLIERIGRRR